MPEAGRHATGLFVGIGAALLTLAAPAMAEEIAPAPSGHPLRTATQDETSAAFRERAEQLVMLLNGEVDAEDYFAPYFLQVVTAGDFESIRQKIASQYGEARSIAGIDSSQPLSGSVDVRFDKGIAHFEMEIRDTAPQKVIGLLFNGFTVDNDSFAQIDTDFAALPGQSGFVVAQLGKGGPEILAARNADRQFAIGSTFKLYVLAELAAAVREGRTSWAEAIPLGKPSLPSGIMQNWPTGMPVTMATLATAMISMSDNSATDTLVLKLGRRQIGARLAKIGHGDPDRALPILTTLEFFALKMDENADMREAYENASEADQPALIDNFSARIDRSMLRPAELASEPRHIDTIEWFASPLDIVALLTYLKRLDDHLPLDIMGVNPGVGRADAMKWDYLGYKGGNEPGVISMNWIGLRKDGQWVAICGNWTNEEDLVDGTRFAALMARLVNLAAK